MSPKPELPRLLVVTDAQQANDAGHDLIWVIREALTGGARAVLLREKHLPFKERFELARAIAAETQAFGGLLIIASDHMLAGETGAGGVHLASSDPIPDAHSHLLVGRSCHEGGDLSESSRRFDYVTYSPVFPTPSKPGYGPATGTPSITAAVAGNDVAPLYALGGVTLERVEACRSAGAYGVAVMGEIMRATDPAKVTAAFVELLT